MGKKITITKPAVLESAVQGWIARRQYKKSQVTAEFRMKVVREIIDTEKSYLQSLECMVLDYLEPVRSSFPPLLPEEHINLIFGKIEDIFLINKELYEQLTATSDDKVAKRVGDIFLKTAPYLKLYSEYCKNYPNAIAKLMKRLEDERFAMFLKKLRGDGSILDLPSLLIMPIQRIPRYKLLLIELLKFSNVAEPDYNDLNVALSKVSEVADHINNAIKERQNLEKLLSIQKKLAGTVPPIVIPRRIFIREGSLMKVCRKVSKRRYFILFNDSVIYCSTIDAVGKYKFHRSLNLLHGKVKDVQDKPKHKNAFQIICKEKSFTVFTDTPEEKKSWFNSFESAFENISLNPVPLTSRFSKHYSYANVLNAASFNASTLKLVGNGGDEAEAAPVWVPDSDAERCMVCASKFNAFRRRHHCRKCGKVVCGKCSDYSYKLDNLNKTVRVCTFCFKDLTQTAPNSVSTLPSSDSFENLSEFISHLSDSAAKDGEAKGGMVTITVKRINANDRALQMVKGKALVPQTHKANRKVLHNITSAVVNGEDNSGEHTTQGTEGETNLPPLPTLPVVPQGSQRSRLTTYQGSSSMALIPNGHGQPRPVSTQSTQSMDDNDTDRRSTDSFDTTPNHTSSTDDLPAIPSGEEQRQVVGN